MVHQPSAGIGPLLDHTVSRVAVPDVVSGPAG